jgi:hypothetical protein
MNVYRVTGSSTIRGGEFDVIEVEGGPRRLVSFRIEGARFRSLRALHATVACIGCAVRNARRNAVLLDKCEGSSIEWLDVWNDQAGGDGLIEDNVNFFSSDQCHLHAAFIRSRPCLQSKSGSGAMIDRSSHACSVTDCLIFDTGNCGAAIAGGCNNAIGACTLQQTADAREVGNVGLYVALDDTYAGDSFLGNAATGNRVYWRRSWTKGRNDWWAKQAAQLQALNRDNRHLPAPLPVAREYRAWLKRRTAGLGYQAPDNEK